jgi:sugar phosphate isomerase/epimerase
MHWGMKMAGILGASHVTLEHPSDDAHTRLLGEIGKKHGIYVAYHGHEQQTPTFWDTALQQSGYNALNLDLGHYVAAGNEDPLGIIQKHHGRIRSMHLKDRQNASNGKANLVWGQGDTPIAEALRLIQKNNYKFPATIELEYEIPEGSDAVREVKKCLEYCHKALS